MPKKRIIFDTQIYVYVHNGTISGAEWDSICRYVHRHFNLRISPLTLYELLNGFAVADEGRFRDMQGPIKILGSAKKRKFLRLPGQFLLVDILGKEPRRLDFEPSQIELIAEGVYWAESKSNLQQGLVRIPGKDFEGKTFGLRLAEIEEGITAGKKAHVETLEKLRGGDLNRSTPNTFAAGILARLGVEAQPSDCLKLAKVVDAAYKFSESLWGFAEGKKYNLEKHSSDWIDFQQLYYLAHEGTYFVTNDPDFRVRTQGTEQRNRIWTLDTLKSASDQGTKPESVRQSS
jgi:hypothetical protein